MTSLFDTDVRNRRNQTPWAHVNAFQFMKDMQWNKGNGVVHENKSILTCQYRPDVASRFWWTIEWTGEDGQRHEASAQELDLCLWRAAEAECRIRERLAAQGK